MERRAGISTASCHKQPRRQACYSQGLNGSCSYVTNPESKQHLLQFRYHGFCLQKQDGCIARVWRPHGERTLVACIRNLYTGPSPGMMVWDAIGYTCRSLPVRTNGTLNSARCVSGVLRPMALRFIPVRRNPTFRKDNTQPHDLPVLNEPSLIRKMFDIYLGLHGH
ncbi:transposable element Tcb1 transposase [Trichonephila clavipes]|nr:transposable element Tcb1 transposase [Trichonephila clavipes]